MPIAEALESLKTASKTKFDSTVELHINLNLDLKKVESLRFTIVLPNGTGKLRKIAVLSSQKVASADLELSESDIAKLENGTIKPKIDFDVLISEPRFMPKLAKAARILGPAGVMPSPKNGTVSEDVAKALEQFKKGKMEVKMEPNATVLHTVIGKQSFETAKLVENFDEVLTTLVANKPQKAPNDWIKNVFVSTTMSKAVEIDPLNI